MDLIQPGLMRRIVDEGVLGMNNNGTGDLHLILVLGFTMIGLVILGGFSGSMNNVFVHMTGQNVGNEIRKDCFRKIMTFSFPQMDRFGTGSLVTRVTNDHHTSSKFCCPICPRNDSDIDADRGKYFFYVSTESRIRNDRSVRASVYIGLYAGLSCQGQSAFDKAPDSARRSE